jgi:hypothetical protein
MNLGPRCVRCLESLPELGTTVTNLLTNRLVVRKFVTEIAGTHIS